MCVKEARWLCNPFGTLHGAATLSMIDLAASCAALGPEIDAVPEIDCVRNRLTNASSGVVAAHTRGCVGVTSSIHVTFGGAAKGRVNFTPEVCAEARVAGLGFGGGAGGGAGGDGGEGGKEIGRKRVGIVAVVAARKNALGVL